jgi:hypothetical protein
VAIATTETVFDFSKKRATFSAFEPEPEAKIKIFFIYPAIILHKKKHNN